MSRRLFRWTFNTLALLSLTALLALLAACLHSRGRIDEVRYLDGNDKLSTLRVHHFEGQFYWLLDARHMYADFPVAIQPRGGLSMSSHAVDSSEAFANDHLPWIVTPIGKEPDPHIDWGKTTVTYDWGAPKFPRFPRWANVGRARMELVAADEGGLTNREFQFFTFPLWAPALFFAVLPLTSAAGYFGRTRWMGRRWETSTARRQAMTLKANAGSLGPEMSREYGAIERTKAGRFVRSLMRLALPLMMVTCLLLSLAVAAMWIRSYWAWDRASREMPDDWGRFLSFDSYQGHFAVSRRTTLGAISRLKRRPNTQTTRNKWRAYLIGSAAQKAYTFVEWNGGIGGFHVNWSFNRGERQRDVVLPDWALVFVLLVPPTAWFAATSRRRNRKRMLKGLCPACGFDLRASPVRCPECGTSRGAMGARVFSRAERFSIFAFGMLVFAGLIINWWTNPLRGATPGPGANPDAGIRFYPVWESPVGTGEDRMHHADKSWGIDWYQSIWRWSACPEDDVMVVITDMRCSNSHFELWRVQLLDHSMHVIRQGQVALQQDDNPYRLLEIRASDGGPAKEFRGRWILTVESIGHLPSLDPLDPRPTKYTFLSQSRVEWDKAPVDETGTWRQANDLQTRSAEPSAH